MPADPLQTYIVKSFEHPSPMVGCRIDPTGKFVFAGAQDNKIIRWDLANDAKTELAAHDSWVRGFAFSHDGGTMVSFGYDGRLIWWPTFAEQPAPIRVVQGHDGWVRSAVVSPDGQTLATCGNDLKVKLWKRDDGTLLKELTGHQRHVYSVAFHPDGQQLASGDLVGRFLHWNLTTGQSVREFVIASLSKYDAGFQADYGGAYSLCFSPDGKRLLAAGITNVTNAFAGVGNPIVVQIDWEAGKDVVTHLTKAELKGTAWGAAFHPDGFIMAAVGGHDGGHVFFWKPDDKHEFHSINLKKTARDLSLHPDNIQFATPHFDNQVRLCRMAPKPA